MCGITALFSKDKLNQKKFIELENMLKAISHRGPDFYKIARINQMTLLGHCRLSLVDVSESSNQPITSECGRYSLIFNGEIYNYKALSQLYLNNNQANSDTKVLLKLLSKFKDKIIPKLNGMFAFIFHDNLTNNWIASTDAYGIKPLNYIEIKNAI